MSFALTVSRTALKVDLDYTPHRATCNQQIKGISDSFLAGRRGFLGKGLFLGLRARPGLGPKGPQISR
jgi:hypothetical protein